MLVLANTLVPVVSLLVGFVSFGLGVMDVADGTVHCEMEMKMDHYATASGTSDG
eukprot:SAG22_NODE_155_length_17123_cov_37.528489_25_plen_54_part_00